MQEYQVIINLTPSPSPRSRRGEKEKNKLFKIMNIEQKIEALLFYKNEPLEIKKISKIEAFVW
jgi:hypothetical protein